MKKQMSREEIQERKRAFEWVKERVREWREEKSPGEQMPEWLWEQAVELARKYSLEEVAMALELSYTRLKRQMKAQADREAHPGEEGVEFVKVGTVGAQGKSELICKLHVRVGEGREVRIKVEGLQEGSLAGMLRETLGMVLCCK